MKRTILIAFTLLSALRVWALDFLPPMDEYWISSETGYRNDPMGGKEGSQLHKGVDMVGPHQAPVRAAAGGVVVEHWPAPNGYFRGHPIYGGLIVIDHLDGTFTLYAHLSSTTVTTGQRVEAGQIIGRQGDAGITTGEHLHFEVIVDPLTYFSQGEETGLDGTAR